MPFTQQTPVPALSADHARVSYQLQLALHSTTVAIKSITAIGNPNLSLAFETRAKNLMTLDAWVDVSMVGDANSVHDICARGFSFPPQGMVFSVGAIVLTPPPAADGYNMSGSRKRAFEFVLCRIAVGRSYVIDAEALETTRAAIPEGYDSLYLHRADDDGADGVLYHHEYLLLDPAQVLPLNSVTFEHDPDADAAAAVQLCEVCNEAQAVLYCQQDDARLCEECDAEIHSANKLVQRHRRMALDAAPSSFGECGFHPGNEVQYFCPACAMPVCVHCKMIGSHSQGEAASHRLVTVTDAYAAALDAANSDDPVLGSRRSRILSSLTSVDSTLRAVNANAAAAEERIYQIMQDALFQLQSHTQAKLALLLGEELELRRQLGEIEWMETFLAYQKTVLKPTAFLASWNKHTGVRTLLGAAESAAARPPLDVLADLQVAGSVSVLATRQAAVATAHDGSIHQLADNEAALADARARMAAQASSNFRALLFRDSPSRAADPLERSTLSRQDASSPPAARAPAPAGTYVQSTAEFWSQSLARRPPPAP